jgi:hypothetical protein
MHQLQLPALLADSPLGFLAAVGTLELTTRTLDSGCRLSWSGPHQPALLHTRSPLTLGDLADHLQQQLPHDPETEPFPLAPGILTRDRDPTPGSPNEPLRMTLPAAHQQLRQYAQAERDTDAPHARWFAALVNQLHTSEKNGRHYTTATPLFAPSGRMTLGQSWTDAAKRCREDPQQLHDALTSWLLRAPGFAGASLDHHSASPAHLQADGIATQNGLPGVTWLALHAFAHYRLTGNGRRRRTTGWTSTTQGLTFTWPVWQPPLTSGAVTTILEHPLIHRATPAHATQLTNLGVTAIYTTRRTRLSNSDGALATAQPLWPTTASEPQVHTETPHRT